MSNKPFDTLEETLEYSFINKRLLMEALSHPSLKQHISKNKTPEATEEKNYERLELLGDALLGFIITEFLFKHFAHHNEGALAKIKSYLVCKEMLCTVAAKIKLADYIIMTQGEEASGGRQNTNNIENTMEALIAAIYLDSDIEIVRNVIKRLWAEFLLWANLKDLPENDPKTALQEWSQSKQNVKPMYKVIDKKGTAHFPDFTVEVEVLGLKAIGSGHSVKTAEKDAAKHLLEKIKTR